MKVYYNFTKKHGSLKGKTPAQASMIEVDGLNRWKTHSECLTLQGKFRMTALEDVTEPIVMMIHIISPSDNPPIHTA